MWKRPKSLCNGEYCSFVNKKSSLCLDVAGHDGYGAVFTFSCEGVADQRLKFVTDRWTAPVASWVMVGCNQNGKVSQTISNTVEYSTITTSVSVSVSASIEADLLFAKASASVKSLHRCPVRGQAVSRVQQALTSRAKLMTTRKSLQKVACGSYR
eukprot:gene13536-biopygen10803